jgi:hypothetical protein
MSGVSAVGWNDGRGRRHLVNKPLGCLLNFAMIAVADGSLHDVQEVAAKLRHGFAQRD